MSGVLGGGIGRSGSPPAGSRTSNLSFFKLMILAFWRVRSGLVPPPMVSFISFLYTLYCKLGIRIEATLDRFIKVASLRRAFLARERPARRSWATSASGLFKGQQGGSSVQNRGREEVV